MGEFGELKNSNLSLSKLYIKTERGGQFVRYSSLSIVLNPPFDVIEGQIRLDEASLKLRFAMNGFECTELFEVAQSGKNVVFEFTQKPIAFTKPIVLQVTIFK